MPLNLARENASDGLPRYVLSGQIDETVKLQPLFGDLPERVVLNLANVDRFNSTGLMHWVRWIGDATRNREVIVESISYVMAIQANHLLDLFGSAKVISCLAPYYCTRCNAARQALVTRDELGGGPPAKKCEQCGQVMDFDELDEFFAFFRRAS